MAAILPAQVAARALGMALALCVPALLGCTSAARPAALPAPDVPALTIHVVSHGWHTGLVIRRSDIPGGLWPESADFPDAQYLEVGWGDRDFYQAPGIDLWLAIKAALWPTPSVLHVVGFSGSIVEYFARSDIVELRLSPRSLKRLITLIHDSHERRDSGRAAAIGPGLYGNSRFYPSRERFHLFNTCNLWTSRALQAAGFPVGGLGSLTASGVLRQARELGESLRSAIDSPETAPAGVCAFQFQRRSARASGSSRTRLPVAQKMALHTAGASGGSGGSPRPVTGLSEATKCASIRAGASRMRIIG
jgi:uncharacterized protein (TIGR02117 family)